MSSTLDTYLHYHSGNRTTCNIGTNYRGYHLIGIHSINLCFSFTNINNSNNIFYYGINTFIVIPNGAYSLTSFNKYLQTVMATASMKVVVSYDGLKYELVSYPDVSSWQ
jgi:hypothetical protein